MAVKVIPSTKQGLLPTPAMPRGLPKAELTDNARQVLVKRYVRRGDDGQPVETVEEMFWRVAYHVAKAEETWGGDVNARAVEFYHLLTSKKFFPNSPTFTGAGTPLGQLAACFVIPISDDMGRHSAGIFQTLRDAALIQQTGGGNGFSFSRLRPKGGLVKSSAGQATGPVGFLRVYDHAFGEIAQGGCLLPETLVFTDKGLLRLDEIVDSKIAGWQEHQLSVPTDEGVKASPRGFNNGMADVLRVHTREGLDITGTPNHKVKVMTDFGMQWKELQNLAKGDWIVVRLGEHTGKLQALKKPTQKHGNQIMPDLPSVLDEEFAFFLGYLAGDGFVAKGENDHRVGVSVAHSSYLMEEMPALLKRLFNVKVHKMQKPNDRSVTFVMDNRAIKDFLSMNGLEKQSSRDVSVPRLIRQSSAKIVGTYLRGLFEADGTLTHGYPTLMTSSARLAREVSTMLIGLGCPVRIRTITAGLDRWGDSDTHQVRITSTVGLQVWREKIGCDRRSRFVGAYAWESDLRRESSYVLPNPQYWLQPVLNEITMEQIDRQGRGRNINFRATEPKLRRQVLRYLRDERNLTRSGYDLIKTQYPEEFQNAPSVDQFWFVEVGAVKSAGQFLTLDLEVADNHTYLAYGMVTHNTRRGANMGVLRVDHPDVEEFITCKTNENAITNFNISVGITDAFMRAVKEDEEWELRFPDIAAKEYRNWSGTLEQAEKAGMKIRSYGKVRARGLFDKIVKQAHHNGEPGVLFLDAANRGNPVPHLYQLESTNPCVTGETMIYTENGMRRAEELAAEGVEIKVVSDARFGMDTFLPATHVFQTGVKPVYRLLTHEGYELRLTEDHRVMTSHGWVETRNLQKGDRIHILNRKGGFGATGTLEEGRVLGWLVGDGTVNVVRAVLSFFGDEKRELAPMFAEIVTNIVEHSNQHRAYPVSVTQIEERDEARVSSERLRDWAAQYGITKERKHFVPSSVFAGSEAIQRGFLQALFTADGQVNDGGEKGCSVRLSSSHLPLLKDVQRLLLNFGIASHIYENRRSSGYRLMPDGKGGTKEYFHQAQHDLAISKSNLIRFANEIGFLTEAKQGKLADYLSRMTRGPYEESFLVTVMAVEPDGVEPVFDLHQPDTHSFIANGLVVHNCGEQFLGPYENCCLGSVNLNEHCGADGAVDWESLRQSVVTATRFLDDVVEANAYVPAVPQLKEAAHRARRIGLGIMGLADLMYHAGVRYGSKEGQEFGAQVMEFVRYHAMQTSIELAEARGPFPAIEGSIYDPDDLKWTPPQPLTPYQNRWTRPEVKWEAILDGIRRHGIRNAAQTTVAPTGCLVPGTLVSTDSGLLPIEALGDTRGNQWQDIDFNVSSEDGVMLATQFYINGQAHTLRVVTHRGYTIQGTDQHRVRVLENGKLVWKRLDELAPGMQIPLQATGLIGKPQRVTLNTSRATNFHPVPATLPEEMIPELAYLIGFFMGDGSLKTRSLRFSISDERLQCHVIALLENVFEATPEAYVDSRSNHLVSLDLHSVNVVEFWKNNGFAKRKPANEHRGKGYLPHIPLAVLQTNNAEIYGAFLAGLFDADGTSHLGRLLSWTTTCLLFHDQAKAMLLSLGILTTSDIQRTGKSNAPAYRLRVAHTQAAERLRQRLPYLTRLSFELSTIRRTTLGDTIPITKAEYQSVLALAEGGAEEQRVWGWRQRGWMVSRETLNSFVERHRQAVLEAGLERLVDSVESEIYYDEIAAIEDGGIHNTYDISVPGAHAYNANGFISHNTIATVAGCEGYGCEPVFALAYIRHVNDHGKDLRLTYASSRFDEALKKLGLGEEKRQEIVEQVMSEGSCQRVAELPQAVRDTFVVSADISAEEHVRMQAALQTFVDNSLSKTVNFPETATVDDVANAYLLAWELGCKGITVYVTGSREKVVLETKATADKKAPAPPPDLEPAPVSTAVSPTGTVWHETKKPRPRALTGRTFNVETPVGKAFITINANGGEQPFEVFINTSKAGSETAAVSEAIGRLISYILRMASPIVPTDRMKEIVRQLMGIGGGRSLGFGPNRVRSLPDGIGQVLDHYLREKDGIATDPVEEKSNGGHITLEAEAAENVAPMRIGDLCPECGEAAVVNEEGCRKCYACGYSEC